MYLNQQPPPQQRRRKKRPTNGLKTVEVARGRNGYGFTISGQHPCILSCIVSGSPADRMGLKTGDFLISVNNQDVSQASHDDVVRMIGSSRGLLILQIAENINGSESSDDELQTRPSKSKYANRARSRGVPAKAVDDMVLYEKAKQRHSRNKRDPVEQAKLRALSPGRELERRRQTEKYERYQLDMRSMGIENIDPSSGDPRVPGGGAMPKYPKHVMSNDGIIRYRSPNTKHTIITREARLGLPKSQGGRENFRKPIGLPPGAMEIPSRGANQRRESRPRPPPPDVPDEDPDENSIMIGEYMRVIVGYVGTVGMARDSKNDSARMQSIRNAVHRLKVERKLTTMVLMEIATNGVRLINTMGSTVALYAAEHIAFSGIHSEDKRFFGIVTIHIESFEDPHIESDISDSSCHVFKVNPELCVHNLHVHKARNFGIHCTVHPETQLCMEFPRSAVRIMKCMSHMYRERPSALYETEMAQIGAFARPNFIPQRIESTSSTSDSGLGFGREDPQGNALPQQQPAPQPREDRVCVVEMPHNNSRQSDVSFRWDSDQSAIATPSGSMYHYGETNSSTVLPEDVRFQSSGTSESSPLSNPPNTSDSSQDHLIQGNTMERLHVRVMPDPRVTQDDTAIPVLPRPASGDHLDQQNSADNIRRGVHRMLVNRQMHSEVSDGVDGESVKSNESSHGTAERRSRQYSSSSSHSTEGPHTTRPPQGPNTTATSMSSPRNESSYLESSYSNAKQPPNVSSISTISTDTPATSFDVTPTPSSSGVWTRPLPRVPPTYPSRPVPQPPVLQTQTPDSHAHIPPIPERKPIIPRRGPKTPVQPPKRKPDRERPKSTPPSKQVQGSVPDHEGDQSGYDSDPGSSIMDTNEKPPEPRKQKITVSKASKDSRRFSEGYALSKHKQDRSDPQLAKKAGSFRQNTNKPFSRRTTISSSHESLVVAADDDDTSNHGNRLHAAASVTAITSKGNIITKQPNGTVETVGRAASWAVSFEKLLRDETGLHIFTDFLKKEFSQENILFWIDCEQFRTCSVQEERQCMALRLFNKHMAANASEPVNVDSTARQASEARLQEAPMDTFSVAQQQIFRLMKQDSYSRFLKSEGYKSCVLAEMEGKPLPVLDSSNETNNNQLTTKAPSTPGEKWRKTLKKSKSQSSTDDTGEEKRRRSLLPWNKKDKGEKKIAKNATDSDLRKTVGVDVLGTPSKHRPSLDLADLNQISQQVQHTTLEEVDPKDVTTKENHRFCRVVLPDQSTTVIPAKAGQTLRQAVCQLCERRQINSAMIDVYYTDKDCKPVELNQDLSCLASKQIYLEKCCFFRLDLPQRRCLCVRCKPTLTIAAVFSPILEKHGLRLDSSLVLHVAGTGVILKEEHEVSTLEHKQVMVQSLDDFKGKKRKEWGSYGSHRGLTAKPPIPRVRGDPFKQGRTVPEVVNHLFKEILDSMATSLDSDAIRFDENGSWDVSKYKSEETRGSGILGFIRRNSLGEKEGSKAKPKTVNHKMFNSGRQGSGLKPGNGLPLPPPPAGRGKRFDADDERLFELLSRAQARQMDDQRGLSARDFELPDFLRVKDCEDMQDHPHTARERTEADGAQDQEEPIPRPKSAPSIRSPTHSTQRHDRSIHMREHLETNGQLTNGLMTPRTAKFANGDDISFSNDGVVPTPGRAMNYFALESRALGDDSKVTELSLQDLGMTSDLQGNSHSYNTFVSQNGKSSQGPRPSPRKRNLVSDHNSHPHPKPRTHKRLNPPGLDSDPDRSRGLKVTPTPSSDEELDITLIPPSDSSCSESELPSPPASNQSVPVSLCITEQANFSPPSPLSRTNFGDKNKPQVSHHQPVPTKRATRPTPISSTSSSCRVVMNHKPQSSISSSSGQSDMDCRTDSEARTSLSTPSPTTHDLVIETDSSSECALPLPPQPAHRSALKKTENSRAKKALSFDQQEAQGDIQVSFV